MSQNEPVVFKDRPFWRGTAEVAAGVLLFSGIKWSLEYTIGAFMGPAKTGTAVANSGVI